MFRVTWNLTAAIPASCARFQRSSPSGHHAEVVIVGGDGVSYGSAAPGGGSWREHMLREVSLPPDRVHFLGRISYANYLRLLQVSRLHIYLTVPFVLSWSCFEAPATDCLVLGSDTPAVVEVIENGVNGVLGDFHSPDAIAAAAIRTTLSNMPPRLLV